MTLRIFVACTSNTASAAIVGSLGVHYAFEGSVLREDVENAKYQN